MKIQKTFVSLRVTAELFLSAALLVLGASASASAQEEGRGLYPYGSYAFSDIESINLKNGNMMFDIPLASLPAGRGGEPGPKISLFYNSMLWDRYDFPIYDPYGEYIMGYGTGWNLNPEGNWRIALEYSWRIKGRWEDSEYPYQYDPHPCVYPDVQYSGKLLVTFPDGSIHNFHPLGFNERDGYTNIFPDGQWNGCFSPSTPRVTSGVSYYTTDGTFLRLEFAYDGNSDIYDNPWTLYYPDGRRITGGGNAPQRAYDRNNNYVEYQHVIYNTHPATRIVDQLGRAITVETDLAANSTYVRQPGVNNTELTTTVRWKTVHAMASEGDYGINQYITVVDQVTLPAQAGGLSYTFGYQADAPDYGWGYVKDVELPSGVQTSYSLGNAYVMSGNVCCTGTPKTKSVTYLSEYDGAVAPTTDTWTYDYNVYEADPDTNQPLYMAKMTNPSGGVTRQYTYPIDYTEWQAGYPLLVDVIKNPDGSVLEQRWDYNRLPSGVQQEFNQDYLKQGSNNKYIKTEYKSLRNAAGQLVRTAIKDFSYDKNNNLTSVTEYDWVDYASVPRDGKGRPTGIPAGAAVKRVTTTAYYSPAPDASDNWTNSPNAYYQRYGPRLHASPAASETGNGVQTLARTEYAYDDPSTTGNVIRRTFWDSAKGSYSNPLSAGNSNSVNTQYNQYGSPVLITDARGTQKHLTYGPVGGYADLYPTQTREAYGTPQQRTTLLEYDFWMGLVTRTTDADNNVTSSASYDAIGRPVLVKSAEGSPAETRTTTEYSDALRRVIVRSDLNAAGDSNLVTIRHFDQRGRLRLLRHLESAQAQSAYDETQGIKEQTRYAFSGSNSYQLVSNPYRSATSAAASAEATMGWSRTTFDSGGRIVAVQTFGGATPPAPWGANTNSSGIITTAYDANFTTVTDQAGKVRRSASDGLGLLARVDEPDANTNLGPTWAPVQPTYYAYDALSNLTQVVQGQQTRTFAYSSLSRLTSATNPESGTTTYTYDANGNVLTKTDARGVTVTYGYDALNRNTAVDYSDTTVSPDISRFYDGATNGKGRFWYDYAGGDYTQGLDVEHRAVDAYDAMGRPLTQRQLFKKGGVWSATYLTQQTYNLAGGVTGRSYPSGRTVTYGYDSAGRVQSFAGNLGDSIARNYATGITYSVWGTPAQEQFGTQTPIYNKLFYNTRGQLAEIRESTTPNDTSWNRGAVINHYSANCWACAGPDDNGDLLRQEVFIPYDDQISGYTSWAAFYDYDSLNRVSRVRDFTGGAQPGVQQTFQYDRYGNRALDLNNSWGSAVPAFETDAAKNQVYAPGDLVLPSESRRMQYDAAGNLTYDAYTGKGQRVYDAEGRVVRAWGGKSRWQYYAYNADGQRVRRTVNGSETWQVYGIDGEMLAEYAANASPSSPQREYGYRNGQLLIIAGSVTNTTYSTTTPIQWQVLDQLGTPRMAFDQTGTLAGVQHNDYLPFGEELFTAARTPQLGYTGSDVRQKFTGKEKDWETGMDFFGARYYVSLQGRFTSPDPVGISLARLIDPQQLNRYTYVRNCPLKYQDPDGRDLKLDPKLSKSDAERLLKYAVKLYQKPAGREVLQKLEKSTTTFTITNGNLPDKNDLMRGGVEVTYGLTKPTGGTVLSVGTGKDEKRIGVKDFVVTITLDLNKIDNRPSGDTTNTGTTVFKHEVIGHAQDYADNPLEATFESDADAEKHAGNNVNAFEKDKRKEDMKEEEAEQEVRKLLGLPPKEEKKRRDKQE